MSSNAKTSGLASGGAASCPRASMGALLSGLPGGASFTSGFGNGFAATMIGPTLPLDLFGPRASLLLSDRLRETFAFATQDWLARSFVLCLLSDSTRATIARVVLRPANELPPRCGVARARRCGAPLTFALLARSAAASP
mmetsp:Transcript_20943/g.58620  ORF Transcript_20943/g.58620 Transcript_20943/m.58620 type:complete len:140 (-) Transcript_20943:120-539(-)